MRPFVKYALFFSALSILLKISVFILKQQYSPTADIILTATYLLTILLAVFFGMRGEAMRFPRPLKFTAHVIFGCKSAAVFALAIAVFLYLYYSVIDPDYFSEKISETMEAARHLDWSAINLPGGITKEAYLKNQEKTALFVFSPFNHATFTLLTLMLVGSLYSVFIAWLQKLVYYNKP